MFGREIAQIGAAFDAELSETIDAVAALRGVQLDRAFTRFEWKGAKLNIRRYPAFCVRPGGRALAQVQTNPGIREAVFPIILIYGYQSQDEDTVQRHMEYVPEAIVTLAEVMDEKVDAVLGVEGEIAVQWDTRPWPGAEPDLWAAWAAVSVSYRLYTNTL